MKVKKYLVVVIIIIILIASAAYFLLKEDSNTSLNVLEQQWIDSNKNNVIDLSIVSDVPILSYNGQGIAIDFLDSLKDETNLTFNKVSYKKDQTASTPYSIKLTDSLRDDNLKIYEDNYVILTKDGIIFNSIDQLNGLNIAVLNENLENINNYLPNSKASFTPFNTADEMITEYNASTELDGIVLLKTTNLDLILQNNYQISYDISEYKMYYVLQFGEEERLNSILTKYFNNWSKDNYEESYGDNFTNSYLSLTDASDNEIANFKSKRYVYGYIDNAPYDTLLNSQLLGINPSLLGLFSTYTDTEISYKKYENIERLVDAFNKNEIDFYYGVNEPKEYNIDVYETKEVYNNQIVILNNIENTDSYSTIKSINKVGSITNSNTSKILSDQSIQVNNYNTLEELLESKEQYIILDMQNYNYYKSQLNDYIISDIVDITDLKFNIRQISESMLFSNFLDFFISFTNTEKVINMGLESTLLINEFPYLLRNTAIILGLIFGILLIILLIVKIKPKKLNTTFSKEDKIRYTDALTSLKNRNYLNDSIDKWDTSEIYPQAIIIIDLKNIAYINDNYGHAEGDTVIIQAANTLITNQLENTEILRTNGNEFLIYMVGYNEKTVITHIRKLHKEMKELKHNFGCAIGYSMINDGIKTIDDAINEASLDMRNNKEENNE